MLARVDNDAGIEVSCERIVTKRSGAGLLRDKLTTRDQGTGLRRQLGNL
jgi:hypothetical protein